MSTSDHPTPPNSWALTPKTRQLIGFGICVVLFFSVLISLSVAYHSQGVEQTSLKETLGTISTSRTLLVQFSPDGMTTRAVSQGDSYGRLGLTEIEPSRLFYDGESVNSLCFVPPLAGPAGTVEAATNSRRVYVCHTRRDTATGYLGIVMPRKTDGRYVLVDVQSMDGVFTGSCLLGKAHFQYLSTIEWTGSVLPLAPSLEPSSTLPNITRLGAVTGTIYPWEAYLRGSLPRPAPEITTLSVGSRP